jgi:hypothetical protein
MKGLPGPEIELEFVEHESEFYQKFLVYILVHPFL